MAGKDSILKQLQESENFVIAAPEEHKEKLLRAYAMVAEKIAENPEMVEAVSRILHWQVEGPWNELKNKIELGATPWVLSAHQGAIKMFSACVDNLTDQETIIRAVRILTSGETEE